MPGNRHFCCNKLSHIVRNTNKYSKMLNFEYSNLGPISSLSLLSTILIKQFR